MVQYPNTSSNPQTAIFSNFTSHYINSNKPITDIYGNIFSIKFTIYKDSNSDQSSLILQTSGKPEIGRPSNKNFDMTLSYKSSYDGIENKNDTFSFDAFPPMGTHTQINASKYVGFNDVYIQIHVGEQTYKLNPEISSLTIFFLDACLIYTNFTSDNDKILLNKNMTPLTYAFNYAFDSEKRNVKYLVSYGEVLSSSIVCATLGISSRVFDNDSNISYNQNAYGIEIESGDIQFDYNEIKSYAFFPPFEGITTYSHDLFEIDIHNISIYLNKRIYIFTTEKIRQPLTLNTRLATTEVTEITGRIYKLLATPLITQIEKRFYMISTNKDMSAEAPRPVDITFSSESESIINIILDHTNLPSGFSKFRITATNILLNDKEIDLIFYIKNTKNTIIFDVSSKSLPLFIAKMPPVFVGDNLYFGSIELQGAKPDDEQVYIKLASFYDRKYKITKSVK
jgi:hypothetical protein